ncbi:hypothetical protein THRCLA_22391 [Thraustotheca clavata]|uniref:PH domain-containing protein n=1 Tax=Thraustotheca clavata TaxID=74557 RepID=A0A1V9Z2W2_9STRA|nr:hypothetical protein THRCLA_22391 [Thraustotheca clavata]
MEGYLLVFKDPLSITKHGDVKYLVLTEGTLFIYSDPPNQCNSTLLQSIPLTQSRLHVVPIIHLNLFRVIVEKSKKDYTMLLCMASTKKCVESWCLRLKNWNRFCFHIPIQCGVDTSEPELLKKLWDDQLENEEKSFVKQELRKGGIPNQSFLKRSLAQLRSPAAWL